MFNLLIDILILIIIIDSVLSFAPTASLHSHPAVQQLRKFVDTLLAPIRQFMPQNLPLDPSPLILIFLLRFLGALL
jgi:uncharacterized protein YggT (Ycf19 family)